MKKPRRPPTLKDVADKCGVSKAAASLALNRSEEECPLLPATRRKIRSAARRLGYRPNWRAKALADRRTHLIGWMTPRPMPHLGRVYMELAMSLAKQFWQSRYQLTFVTATEQGATLLDGRMDGCIVTDIVTPSLRKALKDARLPTVMINVGTDLPYSHILADDRMGGRLATQHLMELGHHRIVFLQGNDKGEEKYAHYSRVEREEGYKEAMRQAGFDADIRVIWEWPARLADEIKAGGDTPTGVVAYSDDEAMRFQRACWERGIVVPKDVSVVGFNNLPYTAHFIPPLTVVEVPAKEMGQAGAELLVRCLQDEDVKPQRIILPETLVVRKSTAAPRK
jgi:LacI family transcriptional regulator